VAKGKRVITAEDRALFWQSINAGLSIKEASRLSGINYQTGRSWMIKQRRIKAEIQAVELEEGKETLHSGNKKERKIVKQISEEPALPPVIPTGRLNERAAKALEDFGCTFV
jgi:hypothetical protein